MGVYKNTDEISLLGLIKADDYAAFNELYERYWSTLYAPAYNVLRDKDACMDVVQEIFIWFWEHRAHWQLSSCKGYLLAAVKFKVANSIRRNKIQASFFERLSERQEDLADDMNAEMDVAELRRFIQILIDELPEKCRQVFQLSRIEQLSNREIAKKLGISEKTVENQITTAIKKLRLRISTANLMLFLFL